MSRPISNRDVVLAFVDQCFGRKQVRAAFERYAHPAYIQHNPALGDGRECVVAFLEALYYMSPDLIVERRHVVAEDDKVVVFSYIRDAPGAPGAVVADMFRVEDGLIVEHWDVAQSVPALQLNSRPML